MCSERVASVSIGDLWTVAFQTMPVKQHNGDTVPKMHVENGKKEPADRRKHGQWIRKNDIQSHTRHWVRKVSGGHAPHATMLRHRDALPRLPKSHIQSKLRRGSGTRRRTQTRLLSASEQVNIPSPFNGCFYWKQRHAARTADRSCGGVSCVAVERPDTRGLRRSKPPSLASESTGQSKPLMLLFHWQTRG